MPDNIKDTSQRLRAAHIAMAVGVLMMIMKLGAYFLTHSAAIFSDALESVVHIAATGMALASIIISSRPADKKHPYGYGNIEYFSAGIEGGLILVAAGGIIYYSIISIITGSTLDSIDSGIVIIAAAGVANLILGTYLIKVGKKTDSLTLIADGKHVLTDSYTSIGVLVGVILVRLTSWHLLDPIVAIIVAINILFTGYKLVREAIRGLMKEVDQDLLQKIVDSLLVIREEYWIDMHELRFWKAGDDLFIDFHMILPYYFDIKTSHAEEQRISNDLLNIFPHAQVKIHYDHCIESLCKVCSNSSCKVRTELHTMTFDWDIEKVTEGPIYEHFERIKEA